MDDFEDGDYTADPAWTEWGAVGGAAVVADPIRPDNLALEAFGSDDAQHLLRTNTYHPRAAFDLSFEFCVPSGPFDFTVALEGADPETDALEWHFSGDDGPGFSCQLTDGIGTWTTGGSTGLTGAWWQFELWHDAATDLVKYVISSDSIPVTFSGEFGGVSLGSDPYFESVSMAFQETTLQYVDNICLTTVPEPSAGLLAGLLGTLGLSRGRRRGS